MCIFIRIGTFFSHVPWLGILVGHIPGAGGPLNTLLAQGRELATDRIRRGATKPDLFYYLVRMRMYYLGSESYLTTPPCSDVE